MFDGLEGASIQLRQTTTRPLGSLSCFLLSTATTVASEIAPKSEAGSFRPLEDSWMAWLLLGGTSAFDTASSCNTMAVALDHLGMLNTKSLMILF